MGGAGVWGIYWSRLSKICNSIQLCRTESHLFHRCRWNGANRGWRPIEQASPYCFLGFSCDNSRSRINNSFWVQDLILPEKGGGRLIPDHSSRSNSCIHEICKPAKESGREIGRIIYSNPDGTYGFSPAVVGQYDQVTERDLNFAKSKCPPSRRVVGVYNTHPPGGSEKLSTHDLSFPIE